VERWCTVTTTDADGRRHSLDLRAGSSYDAAHVYLAHVREHPECGVPRPTLATLFEVVIDAKVYRVEGAALQQWIAKRRDQLKGPKGLLFSRRPQLE
jgi:hypothetical protein